MPFLDQCPECGETDLSWVSQRFGHCVRQPVKFRMGRRDEGYHPGLARFPGDPEAHVTGRDSLNKVIEKRKRMGWEEVKHSTPPTREQSLTDIDPGGKLMEEAYREAAANGFKDPDE